MRARYIISSILVAILVAISLVISIPAQAEPSKKEQFMRWCVNDSVLNCEKGCRLNGKPQAWCEMRCLEDDMLSQALHLCERDWRNRK